MSFLKKLFGRHRPDIFEYSKGTPDPSQLAQWCQRPDNIEYIEAMAEMAAESERTYRGMIEIYNEKVALGMLPAEFPSKIVPSGRGIYKARLFGALFMVMAYLRSGHSEAENWEMMNLATGLALEPLRGQGMSRLTQDEAKSFTTAYLTSALKAMTAAFAAGPFLPESAKREHLALADHLHDALAESIGTENYTTDVRERFAVPVQGNTAMAMNHARRWMAH
jgi:hypothetical protein